MKGIIKATKLNEADIIRALLNSYFIVDYGYINKVNPDKTVNVTHAAKPVTTDGKELPETTTDNVEVLTISGAGFAIQWDYKAKDKVLLLGLKDYTPKVGNVEMAEVPKAFIHYTRSNLKAIPLCIFNDDAKVKLAIEEGKLTLTTEDEMSVTSGKALTIKAEDGAITIEASGDVSVKAENIKANCSSFTVNASSGSGTALEVTP